MPVSLWELAQGEAGEAGISTSEFIRQAIAVRIAWGTAVRAVQAGLDPEDAMDVEVMVARLSHLHGQE